MVLHLSPEKFKKKIENFEKKKRISSFRHHLPSRMFLKFSQPIRREIAVRTHKDSVAVRGTKVLLNDLLAVMRITAALTFVPDFQMDRCFVYTSSRARLEAGLAIGTWVASNISVFSIHVSLQVAAGCTTVRAKVTLLPILLVMDPVVD